jgi:hypothetical protein
LVICLCKRMNSRLTPRERRRSKNTKIQKHRAFILSLILLDSTLPTLGIAPQLLLIRGTSLVSSLRSTVAPIGSTVERRHHRPHVILNQDIPPSRNLILVFSTIPNFLLVAKHSFV